MTKHHQKYFLSALLAGISVLGANTTGKYPCFITAIENRSGDHARLQGSRGTPCIAPQATKKQLSGPVSIPFISFKEYREQFIAGDPYFPEEALVVTTSQGRYAIWQDETGLMCALEFSPGKFKEECIPVPLFKHTNEITSRTILQSLMFLLAVNKQGSLTLIKQK